MVLAGAREPAAVATTGEQLDSRQLETSAAACQPAAPPTNRYNIGLRHSGIVGDVAFFVDGL